MQLSNLPTASISALKSFARSNNLLPTGDLRLKSTWFNAVQEFLTPIVTATTQALTTATSPEAIERYKAAAVIAFRFTYRAFVVSCLLAIALGMSAADTFQSFREWLESQDLTLNQPIAVVRLVASKSRDRASRFALNFYDRFQDWLESQTIRAFYAVDENAIQPAQALRSRISTAKSALLN